MPDIADIERRLERLKIERERLGAVNLRAEEEQKELSERLETIVSEREDVIEAIRKLRHGDPEPQPGRAASGCSPPSTWSTASSSGCSRISSAAARPSCS